MHTNRRDIAATHTTTTNQPRDICRSLIGCRLQVEVFRTKNQNEYSFILFAFDNHIYVLELYFVMV